MRLRRLALLLPLALLGAAAPNASAEGCAGADVLPGAQPLAAARQATVCLTNVERAAAGLAPLVADARLEQAGQAYASRMVAERFFSHFAPDGSGPSDRLVAYAGQTAIGENIATGGGPSATPRATLAAWMGSAGHRDNILDPTFQEIGIGIAAGSPAAVGADAATYVAEYGARVPGPAFPSPDAAEPSAPAPAAAAQPVAASAATVARVPSVAPGAAHRRTTARRCVRVSRRHAASRTHRTASRRHRAARCRRAR